jgi:hypothetical protein
MATAPRAQPPPPPATLALEPATPSAAAEASAPEAPAFDARAAERHAARPRARTRRAPRRVAGVEREPDVATTPQRAAPSDDQRMQVELNLIASVDAALRAGRPRQALALLARHEREFADGFLSAERRALTVLANCKLGRAEDGRADQARVLRRHGGSVLAARIRAACQRADELP